MSEKVRIVRDGIAAFNRGDIDAFVECGHPDIDFRGSGRLPGVRSVQGREAVRAWCTELFDAFDVELQATQFIETADAVAATVKLIAHGKRSGVALDNTLACVWHFQDGLVTACDAYASRTEALEAIGARK